MKKGKLYSKKVKQRISENLSRLRFNWWCKPTERRFSVLYCLCEMCHQNRKSPPGLTPSDFDGWCDECFVDLPDWLRHKKTTAEELARLAKKEKDEADKRRLAREEKARIQNARKKKKVKLTGFENVEDEEPPTKNPEVEVTEKKTNYEEQRQRLESIFYYESDD